MLIRAEQANDESAVHVLNSSAFETASEANLVNALRAQARPVVSLVAENDGDIVGHILFSPVTLVGRPELKIMGLAPMAVAVAHQRKGIGAALIRAGLARCRQIGFSAVVVLGHPHYYPRFGFAPSTRFGIKSEYDVPEDVFMVLELEPGYLRGASGTIKYHAAFDGL